MHGSGGRGWGKKSPAFSLSLLTIVVVLDCGRDYGCGTRAGFGRDCGCGYGYPRQGAQTP
jgi:hypothetical protein